MKLIRNITQKQIILLLILFIGSLLFIRMGSNEVSEINELGFRLIGKWNFSDRQSERETSFTFFRDQTVRYIYWERGETESTFKYEDGKWGIQGNILTMVYPKSDSITFVQMVELIDKDVVRFSQVPDSDFDPYIGTYYRVVR
ncbi:MAG: lipocalin family protein [Weeksellaceae bacterium]